MKLIQPVLLALASIGLAVCCSAAAHAETFYVVNGKTVAVAAAIQSAAAGSEVFQCKSVELKVSKGGTSVSLHAVKQKRH